MARIQLNIGSNRGNRAANLTKAVTMIGHLWPDAVIDLSPVLETEPFGFNSENRFLNMGVLVNTGDDIITREEALEILGRLHEIESEISPESHRNADGSYRDRDIDIDIVDIKGLRMNHPSLTVPHPGLKERPFFRKPYEFLSER